MDGDDWFTDDGFADEKMEVRVIYERVWPGDGGRFFSKRCKI
jgi:hypothetical protein